MADQLLNSGPYNLTTVACRFGTSLAPVSSSRHADTIVLALPRHYPSQSTCGSTAYSTRYGADRAPPMLILDTSALLRRYVADRDRSLVIDAMGDAEAWASSALARTELQLALVQAAGTPGARDDLWSAVREDWDAFWEIPVDGRCLARATEIGTTFGLGTVDAIHLAAADRIPRPAKFLTFERQQIPAAAELGFEVISPFEA
ncbi:MAG: putative nucleic acid-binding protein [Acidimicrobiales bacterium]|jgi:uncharacterized protein